MKEKAKTFAKVRLKCFRDNLNETNNRISNSSGKGTIIKNEEDSHKPLLNEDPCTSNEKGTMTDATLKEKSIISTDTQPTLSSPSSYPNVNNVLKSVSKNKADSKVPIVLLSKSTTEKNLKNAKQKVEKNKKINIFEFIASEFDNSSENCADIEKVRIHKDANKSDSNEKQHSMEKSDNDSLVDELNKSNSSQELSPDFKGFSNSKANIGIKYIGDKICKKKLFANVGKETSSTEKVVTSLDHSYSNDTPEKSKFINSSDSPLSNSEYPRFINRSVFGSPILSKSPPDIMLHNDKINILRQMSQVFNDEKKPSLSSSCLQNNLKINTVNVKLKTSPPVAKTSAISIATTTASITTTIAVSVATTTASITTTATSCLAIKASYSKPLSPSRVPDNSDSSKDSLKNNSYIDKVIGETPDIERSKTDVKAENFLITGVSLSGKPLLQEKLKTTVSENYDEFTYKENAETTHVHLVSSYAFGKEESIKVQSYSGSKGEDIDIVDGFTFFSFNTESEMMNYSPSKSKRKLKKKVTVKSDNSKHSTKIKKSNEAVNTDKKQIKSLDSLIESHKSPQEKPAKDVPFEGFESKTETAKSNGERNSPIPEKSTASSAFSR